jgi:hypothetical protein
MKLLFSAFLFLTILLSIRCTQEKKEQKIYYPKISNLDHHILNDSIHYKVIETELKNHINRSLYIYNKEVLISETHIYHVQKNILESDSYFITNKKDYIINNKTEITINDYKIHNNNYKIEHIDTSSNNMIIMKNGYLNLLNTTF